MARGAAAVRRRLVNKEGPLVNIADDELEELVRAHPKRTEAEPAVVATPPLAAMTPPPPLLPPGVHATKPFALRASPLPLPVASAPGVHAAMPLALGLPMPIVLAPGVHAAVPLPFGASPLPLPVASAIMPVASAVTPIAAAAARSTGATPLSRMTLPTIHKPLFGSSDGALRDRDRRAKAKGLRTVSLAEVDSLRTTILDEVAAKLKVNRNRGRRGYPDIRRDVKRAWPADGAHVTIGE